MNLRSIDLNLLVVLDALLEEQHVSRAALRLGLSQPATSSALERCRALFADPLLERRAGGMMRTPRAEALREPIRAILDNITVVIDPRPPVLAELKQPFRIVMADPVATLLTPILQSDLARTAPSVDLIIQPWHGAAAALESLGSGRSDLAVSVFPSVPADFHRDHLVDETYVVVMRAGHPAAAKLDLETWVSYPHILVSGRGEAQGPLDGLLAQQGLRRRVGVVVPSFALATALLLGSDLLAMLPSRSAPAADDPKFAIRPPPLPVEGFPLHLAWHNRRDNDPLVAHVRAVIHSGFRVA